MKFYDFIASGCVFLAFLVAFLGFVDGDRTITLLGLLPLLLAVIAMAFRHFDEA